MLFDSFDYWLFFAAVALVFYSLPFRYGKVFLIAASYVFYMWWDVRFVVLIIGSTLVDFYIGIFLDRASRGHRKRLLVLSLVFNLGVLAFFKYYNFFTTSIEAGLGLASDSWALDIVLPVGISFYTFASLSYTIDVYRRRIPAIRNLADYALFIAFFPHLTAGPILRASQFLPQILEWRRPSAATVRRGFALVLIGLVKKLVFADRFAVVVNTYFSDIPGHPGWLAAWSAATAFMMQIYFDFSGYTDIARGCAKLLGFEFPLNFRRPYFARNVPEFWQRWHISLSTWVRDYLFMPLSRKGRTRSWIYASMFITMTILGLWHGARWTFVLWGAYFGAAIVLYRMLQSQFRRRGTESIWSSQWLTPLYVGFTFLVVIASAAFFRSSSVADGLLMFRSLFAWTGPPGTSVLTAGTVALLASSFAITVVEERHALIECMTYSPVWIQAVFYACTILALELFTMPGTGTTFIYFQF